jgi:hypothetical protein
MGGNMQTATTAALADSSLENRRIDQVIAGLDQRQVGEGASAWVAQVLGVHSDERDLWVQVAPADNPFESIVLRMSPYATPQHAVAALALMHPTDGAFPHVVNVMRPA